MFVLVRSWQPTASLVSQTVIETESELEETESEVGIQSASLKLACQEPAGHWLCKKNQIQELKPSSDKLW